MFPVTILGAPAWLVPFSPNTADNVTLKVSIEIDEQRGLTGRSSRRPQAFANRHEWDHYAMMVPADFYAARAAVLAAQDEPVVMPFWLAARKTSDAAAMTSGLTVAWTRHWTSYAINPISLAGYDFFAPLLMGVFTQPPRLDSKNTDYVIAEFDLKEDAPAAAALIPPTIADVTLITPDGHPAAIFPFAPEGTTTPKLTLGQLDVDRQQIGPGRQTAEIYFPQARETFTQPSYKLRSSTEIIALMGWWQRRAGGADCFWVATSQKIGDLTADLPIGSTTLTTVAPMSVNVGDTIALCTTGRAPEFVRITSFVLGVPQIAPTSVAHPKLWTTIAPAILARHTDTDLQLNLRRAGDDWIADVTLGFREVSSEYAATDGEVRGTTLGKLPPNAWLARFDLDYSGALQSWFVSNWEGGGTTPDTQVWTYRPWDFDTITQSIDLEEDQSTITIRWWEDCPWKNWLPGKLEATGTVTIYRSPIASDGTLGAPVQVWQGILSTPDIESPIIQAQALGANSLFSQMSPKAVMTPTCWKTPYGVKCGINLSDWTFNAVITAIAGETVTINTISRVAGGGLPAGFGFVDWFALGFAEWENGAAQPIRTEILASTLLAGGEITLTVDRVLDWLVGAAITVAPWCDKMKETCDAYDAGTNPTGKFNNYTAHFGGHFDQPAVSPNFVIPNTTQTPAKK